MPDVSRIQRTYRHLVSTMDSQPHGAPVATLSEDPSLRTATERVQHAAGQLQAIFDAFPTLTSLTVYVGDSRIGVATHTDYPPEEVQETDQESDDSWSRGDGDRSLLPGASRHYKAFRYSCAQCLHPVYSPAPTPPACPTCGNPTSEDS